MQKHSARYKSVDGRIYDKEYLYPTSRDATPSQIVQIKDTIDLSYRDFEIIIAYLKNNITFFRKYPKANEDSEIIDQILSDTNAIKSNNKYICSKCLLSTVLQKLFPNVKEYDNLLELKKTARQELYIYTMIAKNTLSNKNLTEHVVQWESLLHTDKCPIPKKNASHLKDLKHVTSIFSYGERKSDPISYYLLEFSTGNYKKVKTKKEILQYTRDNYQWGATSSLEFEAMFSPEKETPIDIIL